MAPRIIEPESAKMLPALDDANRAFYTGGARGELLLPRCEACGRWIYPPIEATECPACGGGPVSQQAVSGTGTVFTYTLNTQKFHPEHATPNLIAIVLLDEQDDLRIVTNIVGATFEDLFVGMPVQVAFEHHGDTYYPVFEPAGSAA